MLQGVACFGGGVLCGVTCFRGAHIGADLHVQGFDNNAGTLYRTDGCNGADICVENGGVLALLAVKKGNPFRQALSASPPVSE